MNTSFKKNFSIALLALSTFIPIKPLSETAAKVGTGIGATLVGAVAGAGTYRLCNGCNNQTLHVAASGLAGLGIGGLTGHVLYQFLYTLTPPGRVGAATVLIDNVAADSLICNNFATDQALYSHVTARFGTSWPLVIACERYAVILQNLEASRGLLNLAYAQAQGDSNYAWLCSQCEELNQQITMIAKVIEPRNTAIVHNEKYDLQKQLYDKHMEAERNRYHPIKPAIKQALS